MLIGWFESRGEPFLTSLRDLKLWTFENLKVDCWVFVLFLSNFRSISGNFRSRSTSHSRSQNRERFTSGLLPVYETSRGSMLKSVWRSDEILMSGRKYIRIHCSDWLIFNQFCNKCFILKFLKWLVCKNQIWKSVPREL